MTDAREWLADAASGEVDIEVAAVLMHDALLAVLDKCDGLELMAMDIDTRGEDFWQGKQSGMKASAYQIRHTINKALGATDD